MTTKVTVALEHDPADTSPIHLAVVQRGARPGADSWKPALRDTVAGKRVVWARFDQADGDVWLRTRDGVRKVQALR